MKKKLFSVDPHSGTVKYAFTNPDNPDQFVIETHHTRGIHDLMVSNAEERKHDNGKWGEMKKVASIPLDVYFRLKQAGITEDKVAFRKWLNNPENVMFRTNNGFA